MKAVLILTLAILFSAPVDNAAAAEPRVVDRLIGYTELQTDLPGGRHANVRTSRAVVMQADGSGRRVLAQQLAADPDTWTQFAGWSPDGKTAVINRGWQDPENAQWEEEHKTFRMLPGKWLLDSYLLDMSTDRLTNVTGVERVSHYNAAGFLPDGKKLLMTSLIDGVSKPFVMDLDGRNKQDVSGGTGGFAYGVSASPDGKRISYHEGYQVYIANADGSNKRHIDTGHPFDFCPQWAADGAWLMFLSGEHYNCHLHIVRPDGSRLTKLADRAGYPGVIEFLDLPDFHGGSSDIPAWSADGQSVFYTAKVGNNVELFRVMLNGEITPITKTPTGSLHYHPTPSPDGKQLLYGSKRDGVRQLFVMNLADRSERQLTDLQPGRAAMWPHWQPVVCSD